MSTFEDFDLLPSLLGSLTTQGITVPTEIQSRAIPELRAGRSIVGVAETGSGKTLAFVLPVLHRLKSLENAGQRIDTPAQPRAVVVVPTRELGEQVARVFKTLTHETRLRVRTVLGGTTMEVARRNVEGPFEVLVATPGRLVQLLDKESLSLADVSVLILDETDQLLDLGFQPDVARIVKACPSTRQLALFSATVPPNVEALITQIFVTPYVVRSRGSHHVVASLTTVNRTVDRGRRFDLLRTVLAEGPVGSTMIFANTRKQCDKLAEQLRVAGIACVLYRGEMNKVERRANLQRFRDGEVNLLIATDLGSRGLDVEHVGRVINYHLPQQMENYLHRVGRTARAGRPGVVINFVTARDAPLILRLDRVRAVV